MNSKIKIKTSDISVFYKDFQALHGINMDIQEHKVTALIGPSGCGKSTFLRSINRLNELIAGTVTRGQIYIDKSTIYCKEMDVVALRKQVGMVFQKPSVFPMSIYENVAYGPRIHGIKNREQLDEIVENSLKAANLWDEVGERLNSPAARLSGGQQQRLVIAWVLAVDPPSLWTKPLGAWTLSTARLENYWRAEKELHYSYCYS